MSALTNHRWRLRAPELWERNLYIMWLAQATSSMGFSFFFPFVPLFIQELGIKDPGQAALWSGIAGGASGFFMMLSGPLWGVLGDRYGRKMNVVRAMVGSAVVLGMTGIVTDVHQLVGMRIVLGLVSGTWVTVMALASSTAPRHKVPYSIGIVLSASFLGMTAGPVIGGLLSDTIGYRSTFIVTGALCAFAGLVVFLFVDERFQRPEHQEKLGPQLVFGNLVGLAQSRSLMSVLVVMLLVQVGASMLTPVLPVFVGILSTSGTAAFNAGVAYSIMGLTGAVTSSSHQPSRPPRGDDPSPGIRLCRRSPVLPSPSRGEQPVAALRGDGLSWGLQWRTQHPELHSGGNFGIHGQTGSRLWSGPERQLPGVGCGSAGRRDRRRFVGRAGSLPGERRDPGPQWLAGAETVREGARIGGGRRGPVGEGISPGGRRLARPMMLGPGGGQSRGLMSPVSAHKNQVDCLIMAATLSSMRSPTWYFVKSGH